MIRLSRFSTFRNRSFYFLLAAIVIGLLAEINQHAWQKSANDKVLHAEQTLRTLNQELTDLTQKYSQSHSLDTSAFVYQAHSPGKKEGMCFYRVENKNLTWWTNPEPALSEPTTDTIHDQAVIRLPNGWFLTSVVQNGSIKTIGLLLIKHEFAYENRYLQNEFNPEFELPSDAELSSTSDGIPFHILPGKSEFRLSEESLQDDSGFDGYSILCLFAGLLLLISIFYFGIDPKLSGFLKFSLFVLIVLLLRALTIYFQLPDGLYRTHLFSPQLYASSAFNNSLGDLLLNVLVLVCLCAILYIRSGKMHQQNEPAETRNKLRYLLLLVPVITIPWVHRVIRGLIINSSISFDIQNLSRLDIYSFTGALVILILLSAWLLFTVAIFRYVLNIRVDSRYWIFFAGLSALYATTVFWKFNHAREEESRKLIAQKIDVRQDHVAEYLFEDIEQKISNDPLIATMMRREHGTNQAIVREVSQKYFTGYLAKFDVAVYAFNTTGMPADTSDTDPSLSSFRQLIAEEGKPTYDEKLYFLVNETSRLSYLALIPVNGPNNVSAGTLVLRMTTHYFQSEEGFPELFISGKYHAYADLGDYSYARYDKGSLVYEYGPYAYAFSSIAYAGSNDEFYFVNHDDYNHLVYHVSPGSLIVVSKARETALTFLTLFSWLFALYSVLLLLGYVLSGILLLNREFFQFNLNRRIQVSVIVLVILSFVLIGSGTIYYIIWKYSEDQQRSIAGQVNGLWFLVSGLPGSKESLSENWNSEYVASLNQVHQNLNIDFNLYDENGELYYSSQSRIFEQGITSRRMNPHALNELLENGRTQFIHRENIGKLRYIAGYAPFTDLKGNITGFLNLPYFEKQNELNREISGFLSALINIYVILLALSLIVALFISSRITKPLQLIQSKMGQTRLGRRNELIEYKRNDEIGRLVLEYNRMIEELSASAEKLARSERESAWREMARQVAHEIKNPLTPMKLSVQHLQRAWNESQEGKEEMIGRISATLIQQIDTLSQIATEFSDFARMPAAEKINLDLKELIRSETELFRETPGVKITFHEPEFDTRVYADKRQLLRAFSNLLKNAIQAIPEDRPGKIDIRIEREGSDLLVTFEDNGIGIPEDQRDKIFIPNFTTKSSGMGLGLAMVKNILEQHNGSIWYSSVYGQGTRFFVRLPGTW